MHEERVQFASFRAEAGDAIAALFRGAEFELEGGLVARVVVQAAESEELSHRLGADWPLPHTYTRNPSTFNILRSQHQTPPMFGPFRATSPLSGGLLWKIPFRLSAPQKARQRKRLRAVDTVIAVVDTALRKQGSSLKEVERWKAEMPSEEEMRPKDKYTVFDRKEKRYRKGIHKIPKWTRVSQRINPPGF
ncbi:MAG: hypothetical protein Q9226_006509 [Calogaya cf. arnoldii]